jgi:hypothetical protein
VNVAVEVRLRLPLHQRYGVNSKSSPTYAITTLIVNVTSLILANLFSLVKQQLVFYKLTSVTTYVMPSSAHYFIVEGTFYIT